MNQDINRESKQKPQLLRRVARLIKQIIVANVESAGFIVGKITLLRGIIILSALLSIGLTWFYQSALTLQFVWWYAIFHFVFRQSFLLLSFIPRGIAYQLKKRVGERRGYNIYEFLTGMSFFHRSVSFGLLVQFTAWQGLPFLKDYPTFVGVVSYAFIAVGLVVNTWAFLLIKRETYYYLDMYYGRFLVPFREEGPYRWFKNPMYSVGQLSGYGMALASGSLAGLVFALLNQICCYVFYYSAELPHIKRVLQKNARIKARTERTFRQQTKEVLETFIGL